MQDIRIPVTVGGVTFKNPFYVASGPTTKTVRQLVAIEKAGWAGASIKLSIDPAPYINRKPRYDLFEDRNSLAFTTEKRLTFQEGLTLVREAKKVLNDLILFANITYAGDEGVSGWVNMAVEFEKAGADIIELNMCCPNMSFNVSLTTAGQECTAKQTGASLGQQGDAVAEIVRAIKEQTSIPLFVKLTPEGGKIAEISKQLYAAGADAVSGTGNRMGMPVINLDNPEKAVYHLQEEISMSCHSGAWLKPLAQRDTYEMRKLCGNDVKIAATGGITSWKDAVEMIMCGGDLLGICAETLISGYNFVRPMIKGMHEYMEEHGYKTIEEFRGKLVPELKTAQDVTLYSGYAKIMQPKLSGPCKAACPHHVPAQAYVQSVGRGEFKTAFDIITEKGLLQSACAYVCPHPCEDACVRGAYGKPVRIRELKRYVLEKGQKEGWKPEATSAPPNGKKVAVAGAGAAGISAASELAAAGYLVALYEKEEKIGGMLRSLTASGRLPAGVLENMEATLVSRGAKIITKSVLGRDFSPKSLLEEGFDAVLVATGGEGRSSLPENMSGAELAKTANELFEAAKTLDGKKIAIIGDGLTALEAALAARKLGADGVCLVGSFNDKQSAVRELKAEAQTQKISIFEGAVPSGIEEKTLLLSGNGGTEIRIPCDAVYVLPVSGEAEVSGQKGVFTTRKNLSGGVNVIAAAAEGERLASEIDVFLRGEKATILPQSGLVSAKRDAVLARTGALPLETSENKPVSSDEEAIREANRCLGCGCGEGCQLCKTICTDFAPQIVGRDELQINREECVACGMCYNRCPNGNIDMINTGERV